MNLERKNRERRGGKRRLKDKCGLVTTYTKDHEQLWTSVSSAVSWMQTVAAGDMYPEVLLETLHVVKITVCLIIRIQDKLNGDSNNYYANTSM